MPSRASLRGFTLIELMIAVAVSAILASIALPSFAEYVRRSRVPAGLTDLLAFQARMEQRYQDIYSYASGNECGVGLPVSPNFTFSCVVSEGGQTFQATATGVGSLAGYGYSIDHNARRVTQQHPKGLPGSECWTIKGAVCDT